VAGILHANAHPDSQRAVHSALWSHNLRSVSFDQDQDKGVIRLTGIVQSSDSKDRAQQLAQQAAPGYTIDNQIQVNRAGLM
jgi:osmotically-inducible protein OsmY